MTSRPLLAAFAAVSLVLTACGPGISSAPDATTTAAPTATEAPAVSTGGPPRFEGERAYEHLRQLSSVIGTRVAGSDGERRGAEYVANAFTAMGYSVETTEFSFAYELSTAEVVAGGKTMTAAPLSGSGAGTVTAKAVAVGNGSEAGVAGKPLAGAIAVAERGVVFGDVHDRVRAAGAVGLIMLNSDGGSAEGNLGKKVEIQVVMVDEDAREAVRTAARDGGSLTLTVEQTTTVTSRNVLARPAKGQTCLLLVGGHMDTVPGAPGALDNGSGTASVVELARAFAADGLDAGLCFAAFGAKEEGLFGSAAMVKAMQQANALPRAMINLDMTGLGTVDLVGNADLAQQAENLGKELGIKAMRTTWPSNFGSDHMSFQKAGVPSLTVATSELGKFHTPGDVLATIDPSALEATGDLAYALIAQAWKRVAQA